MLIDRRRLLQAGLGAAWAMSAMPDHALAAPAQRASLYRWCPAFPIARELWMLPFAGDVEEGMLLETAAGLAARAGLHGIWRTLLYENLGNDGYQRWFDAYRRAHRPRLVRLTLDEAVERLAKAGIVKGYTLYRFDAGPRPLHSMGASDESANVATALAGLHGALAVSEKLEERARRAGLKPVLDVRGRKEAWCLEQFGGKLGRRALGTADPKTRNARSLMVAMDAFVCSGHGPAYERGLARCDPDSPVIGWGIAPEDTQTIPSSRWGLFQTATNWCHNLPVFAGETAGKDVPAARLRRKGRHWSDLDWGDGRHYASLVMSDGDNVQWVMGNFTGGPEARSYYGHPKRGAIPFGWGLPVPSLAQLSPRTLEEVLARATHNDDFVMYAAGGYMYPDLYGAARPNSEAMRRHGEHVRGAMELTGIRTVAFNFQDWDGDAALRACEAFASQLPGLLGIVAFQYYPYSAGDGAIRWVKGAGGDMVPVVSCRLCIWAQTGRPHDTTPAAVAAWLNRMPRAQGSATDQCFSWVVAHAWSRFRPAPAGAPLNAEEAGVSQEKDEPGTERGYAPAVWAAQRFEPHVAAVTPEELLWRIRLRLRPQATLTACAAEVGGRAHLGAQARQALAQAKALLPSTAKDPAAARKCFELLRRADRL